MNDSKPFRREQADEADLATQLEREERSERWLLIRQVVIILLLAALLITHALLG